MHKHMQDGGMTETDIAGLQLQKVMLAGAFIEERQHEIVSTKVAYKSLHSTCLCHSTHSFIELDDQPYASHRKV